MGKTVKAKLRCLDMRGETTHTRWGYVTFDKDGLAELEVPEEELQMLRDIRPFSWLAEDHVPKLKDNEEPSPSPSPADEPPAPPASADVAFDTSDTKTPPQGIKKITPPPPPPQRGNKR